MYSDSICTVILAVHVKMLVCIGISVIIDKCISSIIRKIQIKGEKIMMLRYVDESLLEENEKVLDEDLIEEMSRFV